jgi:DNA-binding XRE family transcriptional regulator
MRQTDSEPKEETPEMPTKENGDTQVPLIPVKGEIYGLVRLPELLALLVLAEREIDRGAEEAGSMKLIERRFEKLSKATPDLGSHFKALDKAVEPISRIGDSMASFASTLDNIAKMHDQFERLCAAHHASSGIFEPVYVPEDHPEAEEEAADRAAYLEAKARDEEALPHAVVKRLVAGEHPVKVFREHRGLTQAELAERAGSRAAYISQIETGKREGSRAMLRKLAKALDVELADLLE